MILILTMAGVYQRFRDEGINVPKYLLPWGSKNILQEVLELLLNGNRDIKKLVMIINDRDKKYLPHIAKIASLFNINTKIVLTKDTLGQAESLIKALNSLKKEEPKSIHKKIIVHNIDTLIYGRDLSKMGKLLNSADGVIDVFNSHLPQYSYVAVQNDVVIKIVEKKVISKLATSGLYCFKNGNVVFHNYKKTNLYISDIYQNILAKGGILKISISKGSTVVLGTPKEYFARSKIDLMAK